MSAVVPMTRQPEDLAYDLIAVNRSELPVLIPTASSTPKSNGDRAVRLLRAALVSVFFAVAIGNWHTPISPKGAGGDLYACWGLAAFVFGPVYQAHRAFYIFFVEASGDDLANTLVFFDVGLKDRVEDLVGRQGVHVALVLS
jgi:hypothetical protein